MGDVSQLLKLTDPVHLISERKQACVSDKTLLLLPDMVKTVLEFHINHLRPLLVRKGQAATSSASPVVDQTDLAHASKLLDLSEDAFQQRLFQELASQGVSFGLLELQRLTKFECIVAHLKPPGGWATSLLTAKQVYIYHDHQLQAHVHLI